MSTECVIVAVDESGPGGDKSVEVTAKHRADGGIDILSMREHPQAVPYVAPPAPKRNPNCTGQQPAQPSSGEASIQQCCDDLFEAGRTVAHYEDPRLRPLSKEDFILYDAARKRAAAARDRLQSALEAAQREIVDLRNRLNLSEKLQGRLPVDAVQPADTKEPG